MSIVYFSKDPTKVVELFEAAGLNKLIASGEEVALKIHFGEPGNNAYLKPPRVNGIRDKVKELGGKPFFTDANTLYKGSRDNTKEHLKVAKDHGFEPVIISEENDHATVEVNSKRFKKVYIAGAAARAKAMLVLTHFKGHDVTGFGGALKNIGMGLGTRLGKLRMHQDCENCPEITSCQKNQTIESCWVGSPALVQEKMDEYALGVVKNKRMGYISFLTDISPDCDCYPYNDPPVVPDLGVLVSLDPVAIDQASIDLVNQAAGKDVFRELYPQVDWAVQLSYAEEIGLGSRKYELVIK